jgi:integrase
VAARLCRESGACRPGSRHSVRKGSTTVMSSEDTSAFLKSIDTSHVVGLRDRALIAVMVFAFARVSAVVGPKVEDYFPLKKRWWLRLHEKGGKVNEMGCHHKLEEYLDAYIAAAGIADDKKGPLFRAAIVRPVSGSKLNWIGLSASMPRWTRLSRIAGTTLFRFGSIANYDARKAMRAWL